MGRLLIAKLDYVESISIHNQYQTELCFIESISSCIPLESRAGKVVWIFFLPSDLGKPQPRKQIGRAQEFVDGDQRSMHSASRALTSCKPAAVLLAWAAPGSGWLWMALRRYGTLGTITLRMECVLRSHTFAARAARPVNAVTVAKGPVLSGVLKCSKCCNTVATLQ